MTEIPDSHRDLLETQFGTLGTVGDDGLPQLTVIWFLYEDGDVKVSLNDDRVKTRNLRERPECSLLILDLQNPFRYLELRGHAELERDDDYAFAERVGRKYDADLRAWDSPGSTRVIATIRPDKVHAVDMSH